jgi:hypothetical protein
MSDFITAAYTHEIAGDGQDSVASGNWFDTIANVPTFVTQIGISALTETLNIPTAIASIPINMLGGDYDGKWLETENVMAGLDDALGTDMEQYYNQRKEAVDMGGFIASSFVPGLAGAKALRVGLGTAAKSGSNSLMVRAIGNFERIPDKALQAAKLEIAEKASPFTYMNTQAFKLYAAGAGQGALDALAFNTAATVALHQSSYLEEKDWGELTKDVLFDSLVLGGSVGAVFDVAGKGAGIFGYKSAIKSYSDQFANVKATALNPFKRQGTVEAGSQFTRADGAVIKVSPGTAALLKLDDVKSFEARTTELKALLDDGALSADNATLLQAEMRKFTELRNSAIADAQLSFTNELKGVFKGVDDFVDVDGIAKQLLDPANNLDSAATILSDLTGMARLTVDDLSDLTMANSVKVFRSSKGEKANFSFVETPGSEARLVKATKTLNASDDADLAAKLNLPGKTLKQNDIDDLALAAGYDSVRVGDNLRVIPKYDKKGNIQAPRAPRSALLDLRSGAIVNKAHNATAWDLGKKDFDAVIASLKPEKDVALDISGANTAIENSAIYRNALDMFKRRRLNEASSIAELDVLVQNRTDLTKTLRYNGKEITEEAANALIASEKTRMADEMLAAGYSHEQISAGLMIPEETLFNPTSLKGFSTAGDASLRAPRYVQATYSRERNMNKFDLEGKLEVAKVAKLTAQQVSATVAAINKDIAAVPSIRMPKYTENFTAGAFSFADAKFGRVFEESVLMNGKLYAKITQKAAQDRVLPIRSKIEAIRAAGVGSADHTEFTVLNAWNKQAKNYGGGHTIAIDGPNGTTLMEAGSFRLAKGKILEEIKELKKTDSAAAERMMEELNGQTVLRRHLADNPGALSIPVGKQGSILQLQTSTVDDFVRAHIAADSVALNNKNKLKNLYGETNIRTETLPGAKTYYDPNINMRNAQHVLIIKGAADHGNPLYAGQQYVFAGKSVDDLRSAQAWANKEGLQTFTKTDTEQFYKQLDEFDSGEMFRNGAIKESLESQGKLTSYTGAAESIEDTSTRFLDWHLRDEFALQRTTIAAKEHEVLGALKNIDLADRKLLDSHKGNPNKISRLLQGEATKLTKPEQIRNTIFNTQNPGVVNALTKSVDDFGIQFFTGIRNFFGGLNTQAIDNLTGPEANATKKWLDNMKVESYVTKDILESIGIKNYDSPGYSNFVRMSNMALVTGQLRLDALNSLVNVIGMPIIGSSTVELAIRSIMGRLKAEGRVDDANNLMQSLYQKEGSLGYMPSTYLRMAKQSMSRFGTLAKDNPILGSRAQGDETLAALFLRENITFNPAELAAMDLTDAALAGLKSGNTKASYYAEQIKKYAGVLTKPADAVESRIQFISADAALQIAEAGKLSADEAILLMHTMVNKMQGNFNASTKPQLFQGITGSALGLFQSYQARLVHRLSDVITDGNKRMLFEAGVLQTSIFGGKSLPFMEQLNSSLVAGSNDDNADLYSSIYGAADKNLANALTYGLPSALLGLNLSSRGNATPRFPQGITDIPAINIWYKQLAQIKDIFSQAADGADISQLFNHAVQHNVFNRPLQQTAIMLSGYATTANNKLGISLDDAKLANDNNWLPINLANYMRIAGSRPIDEAVIMDTAYRWQGYQLADREKREELGRAVSSQLLGNDTTLDADSFNSFLTKYQNQGGDVKGFEQFVKGQAANSTLSAGSRMLKVIKSDAKAKQLQYMLGKPPEAGDVPSYDEIVPRDPEF